MANVNRYWGGETNKILVPVLSGVTVEVGDLLFYDDIDGLRKNGNSVATFKAFPMQYMRTSGASLEANKHFIEGRFLGVAMDNKAGDNSGVTKDLSIATTGIFNFELRPARTVYFGYYAGPSGTTTGSNIDNQKVAITTNAPHSYGYFVERKVHALSARVSIMTKLGRRAMA